MPALDQPLTLEGLLGRIEKLEGTVEQQGREIRNLKGAVRRNSRDSRDGGAEPVYATQMIPSQATYASRPAKRQRLAEPAPVMRQPVPQQRYAEPPPVVRTIVQPIGQPMQMMQQPMGVPMQPMQMGMQMAPMGGMSDHATQLREPGPGEAQIHIQVEGNFVRDLIGPKGANVNRIQRDTGAHIHFEKLPRDQWHLPTICTLTGRQDSLIEAVKLLAASSAELAQSRDHKVILCVPDQHYGFVVGKRGANIKRLKDAHENVRIDLTPGSRNTNQHIALAGMVVSMCTVYGPPNSVAGAIGDIMDTLHKAQTDRNLQFHGKPPPQGIPQVIRGGGGGGGGFQQQAPMGGGGGVVYAQPGAQQFAYAQPPRGGARY